MRILLSLAICCQLCPPLLGAEDITIKNADTDNPTLLYKQRPMLKTGPISEDRVFMYAMGSEFFDHRAWLDYMDTFSLSDHPNRRLHYLWLGMMTKIQGLGLYEKENHTQQDLLGKPQAAEFGKYNRILMRFFENIAIAIASRPKTEYTKKREAISRRDSKSRKVPTIPPKNERIRVIFDTDARNEIDDVWAIALAILCPERFKIEGFVAANFDNSRPETGPDSIEASFREIHTILDKAGLAGKWPVLRGSHPMRYKYEPSESEGVDFIIKKAMESTPEDPLWIVGLGAATNIASAYLKEPRIKDRVVVFWHFRTRWPEKCWNFNVIGDVRAARTVFHSDLSFVLFDTGTHLYCPMEESEKYLSYGDLGRYLHEYRYESSYYQRPNKGFFDLGDIAVLVDPSLGSWEVVDCPEVEWDLAYKFRKTKGKILRCCDVDRDGTYALLERKLRTHAGRYSAPD